MKGLVSKYPYDYYTEANGFTVVDTKGDAYWDMGIMGVGACILGYADPDVNNAVKECIDRGSMSTLNCPEDEILAELLLDLHPWADKVRYARTGGEACKIALDTALSHLDDREYIQCGYSGWHLKDPWYSDDFEFNNVEDLKECLNDYPEVILLEILRHEEPTKDFLDLLKKAQSEGVILIIDEITSGFRMCNGGAHMYYDLEPDIAVFGKAIGNGFPITAVIGKEEIMNTDAFISSTFWTERIGPIAAIATIDKILRENVVSKLDSFGQKIRAELEAIGVPTKLPNSLIELEIENVDYFQKEMAKRGYIARNQIYLSYAHVDNEWIIDDYVKNVKEVLKL